MSTNKSHRCGVRSRGTGLVIALLLLAGVVRSDALSASDAPRASERISLVSVPDGRAVPTVVRAARARPDGRGAAAGNGVLNGDFAAGLDGWRVSESGGESAPGEVRVEDGRVVMTEGDSFLVTLEQTFVVAEDAGELTFALVLEPGFDRSAEFIPDAFEVSLLDAGNVPVLGSWDALATSSFNLAEDGSARTSPEVEWDGETVRIDLRALPVGLEVTLLLDLIGADPDTAGGLQVDDVSIDSGPAPGSFVRGNSNGDASVNISDASYTLGFLFLGGAQPGCLDAADANNDSKVDISDASYTLNFLFLGGPVIPAPYPECGIDAGPVDLLDCEFAGECK